MTSTIGIETSGSHDTGICECRGHRSRTVWGYAYRGEVCIAAYYVHWTLEHVREHGANFDLILGEWGDDALQADHRSISLLCRVLDNGPWFMVIDARGRPFTQAGVAGTALDRSDVIGTEIATAVFAIVDAIVLNDLRLAELSC